MNLVSFPRWALVMGRLAAVLLLATLPGCTLRNANQRLRCFPAHSCCPEQCCPDNYQAKCLPDAPCPVKCCPDDYCAKCLPCEPCAAYANCCDDYCQKCWSPGPCCPIPGASCGTCETRETCDRGRACSR